MIERITLTAADEKHAPPEKVIVLSVSSGCLFIEVAAYHEESKRRVEVSEYEVPPLDLAEFLRAVTTLAGGGMAIGFPASSSSIEPEGG